MVYGIAMFPSEELQNKANEYRMRYDSKYALIRPHITLIEEFEANEYDKDNIINRLHETASRHQPIEVKIEKVSTFDPTSHVIYFKVEKTDAFLALYDDLNQNDFYGEQEHPFIPHITIAQGLSNQEHDDLYSTLKMVGIKHTEMIDEIALCEREENGPWEVVQTFKLGQ